jgi:hypothetical protein
MQKNEINTVIGLWHKNNFHYLDESLLSDIFTNGKRE